MKHELLNSVEQDLNAARADVDADVPSLKRRQGRHRVRIPDEAVNATATIRNVRTRAFQLRSMRFCKFHCCKKSMIPTYLWLNMMRHGQENVASFDERST